MNIPELMESLARVADDETAVLAAAGGLEQLRPLTTAKARLLDLLEAQLAERHRTNPEWPEQLDVDTRARLQRASAELAAAAERNRAALSRQLELSDDLVAAVAGEVQRLTGSRNRTYAEAGRLREQAQPSPISVNTRI